MLAWCGIAGAEPAQPGVLGLLMPGKLATAHAELEADCDACHQSFAKEAQDSLCRDCHDEVDADIAARVGFHGKTYEQAGGCGQCHREHQGRDGSITTVEPERFDHSLTDFPLEGAHAVADCGACHQPEAARREAPARCVACHREADRHRGAMGDDCGDCHRSEAWQDVVFDHGAGTDFPLRGRHVEATCSACHPGERYVETPAECVACHAQDDVHGGRRGQDCAGCHSEQRWDKAEFDHDRNTGFALHGAHRDTPCGACHIGADVKQVAGKACVDCHRIDDVHAGRNGSDCQHCHNEIDWVESRFDHGKDADFPLLGRHADAACEACHTGEAARGRECNACHAVDDAHRGALGNRCASCHDESGWGDASFSHDLANFPLLGMHRLLACDACHLDQRFSDTPAACGDCHRYADVHAGSLGTACGDCHNPGGWGLWQFDHGTATRFPLDGAHAGLDCQACHQAERALELPMDCHACHRQDDRHSGRFGRDCGRCHTTTDFGEVKMLR